MIKIKTKLDKHPITGLDQEVELSQIAYMDFDIQEAKVKFTVHSLDKDGNRIDSNATTYEVWEHFCNSRILTKDGRTINEANFHINEGEDQETYENRLNEMKSKGIPEFDFWITPLVKILSGALEQGKHLLNLEQ